MAAAIDVKTLAATGETERGDPVDLAKRHLLQPWPAARAIGQAAFPNATRMIRDACSKVALRSTSRSYHLFRMDHGHAVTCSATASCRGDLSRLADG